MDLSPPGEINHKISFMSQSRLLATNKCHAAEPKLAKFYEKLNDLLIEFIRSTKALVSDQSNAEQRHQANKGDKNKPLNQHMFTQKYQMDEEKGQSEASTTMISKKNREFI